MSEKLEAWLGEFKALRGEIISQGRLSRDKPPSPFAFTYIKNSIDWLLLL